MKTRIVTALFLVIVLTGSIAFAEEAKTDCSCVKGGIGIPIGKFIIGFGYRTFSSALGCDTNIGLGVGLGADNGRVQIGVGYNQGVIGLGIGVKGPSTTTSFGFVIGYDYGDCRMVWPYEE